VNDYVAYLVVGLLASVVVVAGLPFGSADSPSALARASHRDPDCFSGQRWVRRTLIDLLGNTQNQVSKRLRPLRIVTPWYSPWWVVIGQVASVPMSGSIHRRIIQPLKLSVLDLSENVTVGWLLS